MVSDLLLGKVCTWPSTITTPV